ncbi:hypothetical protein KAM468_30230 [Aeromonas caviae]|nr:hypothetical protein KAM468_30230 [Aeromonas caviae]
MRESYPYCRLNEFIFFKQKTAYEISLGLVGSEMCIRDSQILLRQQLKHLGHDVSVRSNGLEALRALASHPFDLVITDCQMPVMDGFELTRNLRALGHDLPVWGFTAHAQPRERELCLAAGMNDCLFKPIGLARLRAALATLGPAP